MGHVQFSRTTYLRKVVDDRPLLESGILVKVDGDKVVTLLSRGIVFVSPNVRVLVVTAIDGVVNGMSELPAADDISGVSVLDAWSGKIARGVIRSNGWKV